MNNSRPKKALQISLAVSALSLLVKSAGYFTTGSTTALSDAAESVIHVLAVAIVYYGFLLSFKPADEKHLYGHERVEFLSVGVEGTVIVLASLTIVYKSITNYLLGHSLHNLNSGILLLSAAGAINFILGSYLVKVGRRENNMIVLSNGRHTLTDVWTSLGAVTTLVIIKYTGWTLLDALVGISLAAYIMIEGFKLLRYSIDGLMDSRNPEVHEAILRVLNNELPGSMTDFHKLRHRTTGNTTWIELHALFEKGVNLKQAHEDATALEKELINAISGDVIVTIHLEPEGSHEEVHKSLRDANQRRPLDDFI